MNFLCDGFWCRWRFSRNNVLHLWPFTIVDLKNLGAKLFYGKFCAGSIDHISESHCVEMNILFVVVFNEVSSEHFSFCQAFVSFSAFCSKWRCSSASKCTSTRRSRRLSSRAVQYTAQVAAAGAPSSFRTMTCSTISPWTWSSAPTVAATRCPDSAAKSSGVV